MIAGTSFQKPRDTNRALGCSETTTWYGILKLSSDIVAKSCNVSVVSVRVYSRGSAVAGIDDLDLVATDRIDRN